MMYDKRRYTRYPSSIGCRVLTKEGKEEWSARISDISRGGARLLLTDAVGDVVSQLRKASVVIEGTTIDCVLRAPSDFIGFMYAGVEFATSLETVTFDSLRSSLQSAGMRNNGSILFKTTGVVGGATLPDVDGLQTSVCGVIHSCYQLRASMYHVTGSEDTILAQPEVSRIEFASPYYFAVEVISDVVAVIREAIQAIPMVLSVVKGIKEMTRRDDRRRELRRLTRDRVAMDRLCIEVMARIKRLMADSTGNDANMAELEYRIEFLMLSLLTTLIVYECEIKVKHMDQG